MGTTSASVDDFVDEKAIPGRVPTIDEELFEWKTKRLPAMKEISKTNAPSLLFQVGELLDDWGKGDLGLGEYAQFLNPTIQPQLRTIKRVFMQPAMTETDKRRLLDFKAAFHDKADFHDKERPKEQLKVADKLFKVEKVGDEYEVFYAIDSIPYTQAIAITYAWHESEYNEYKVTLNNAPDDKGVPVEGNKGQTTLKLGPEWKKNAVLGSLVELSNDSWIWMDQFSLNQDKVTTKELTSDIPTIYRHARVVAFLPYTVCDKQLANINKFQESMKPDVAATLAEMMLHDLVCECTDGIYGWLSRLWPWQELMLASSLRFVWGLGESKWSSREYYNKGMKTSSNDNQVLLKSDDKKQLFTVDDISFSQLLAVSKAAGEKVKATAEKVRHVVNHSITNISIFDQPITRLLNELIKRNSESVIIPESDTATLSMNYYFCVRLLCGAEVYMPSAIRVAPIDCLKVLQQIASTGRKGGKLYDCYFAGGAFIGNTEFLQEKPSNSDAETNGEKVDSPNVKSKLKDGNAKQANAEATRNDVAEELSLRQKYIALYEGEHAKIFKDTKVIYAGAPVPNKSDSATKKADSHENFHPIAWQKDSNSKRILRKMNSSMAEISEAEKSWYNRLQRKRQEEVKKERTEEVKKDSNEDANNKSTKDSKEKSKEEEKKKKKSAESFLNAFVLSGMNEEAFCETLACGTQGFFCGTAHDIISIKPIKVGRMQDVWMNSIYKIVKNLHPSQLTRVRNFNTIPIDMNLKLYPLAHAIIHATCFRDHEYPAHLAHIVSSLRGQSTTTKDYVNAVAMLVGEGFDFILDGSGEQKNQFELAKITFSDGTRCVGIISNQLVDTLAARLVTDGSTPANPTATDTSGEKTASKAPESARKEEPVSGKEEKQEDEKGGWKKSSFKGFNLRDMKSSAKANLENAKGLAQKNLEDTKTSVQKLNQEAQDLTMGNVVNTVQKLAIENVVDPAQKLAMDKVVNPAHELAKKKMAKVIASATAMAAVKIVKSHHRLLLCGDGGDGGDGRHGAAVSDWNVVGYIPGVDAMANKVALGPISHSGVRIKMVESGKQDDVESK